MSAAPTSTSGKPSNMFAGALQAWTEIDLASLQKKLDQQGIELKLEQKLSLASRKDLAQKTKEFRKLDDEQKLAEVKLLLKLYQNEIDVLTTKLKKVEGFFFGFYRLLAEAPDPRPLLELSLDAVLERSDAAALRAEVARLNEELTKRADYDVLKQRLLRTEQKLAEVLGAKLKAQEEQFQAILDEKESNWASIRVQHDGQIAGYKATIEELRTSKEVTELQLNSHNKLLPATAAALASVLAELDMVTRDVETWKKRVFELEKRNEELRRELSALQTELLRLLLQEEFSKKIADLEGENAFVLANLNQVRAKLDTAEKEAAARAQSAARELLQATQEVKSLKEKLERTSDYDEVKNELQLLRQIEFGEGDADADSVDGLLLGRNKAMTKELAEFRSQHGALTEKITALESQLAASSQELSKAHQLNAKLESDLADLQDASGNHFNDTASMISGMTRNTRRTSISGTQSGVDEALILPIITKQRDRFRDKNKELEEDLRKNYAAMAELKRKNKHLQADNEELYEKTRYMASLKNQEQALFLRTNRKLLTPKANVLDLENPYRDSYETKLHPIEQFRQREQERVNSRLSPFERLFIFITRSVLATRATRMLFLAYCVFLHCIVMFTTVHSINLSTKLIPEVGLNHSTGGVADESAKVMDPSI